MPTVSIIVPNYNHAVFLTERLDSIFNQTFDDFEVILLDDCSQDESVQILSAYAKHPKVTHFVINEINSGSPFKQWKKGLELATGEYIWIAESDDWCEPEFLQTLTTGILKSPGSVLAYAQSASVMNNGEKLWSSTHRKREEVVVGTEYIRKYLVKGNAIFNASMAIFRKSVIDKISEDYLHYKFCGDWLFWAEVSSTGNVYINGKQLNYFRSHTADVSTKAFQSGLSYREEVSVLESYLQKGYIRKRDFIAGMTSKYQKFYNEKHALDQEIASQIKQLLETHPTIIPYIRLIKVKVLARYCIIKGKQFIKYLIRGN